MARAPYKITDRDYQYVTDYLDANYLKMTMEATAGYIDYDAYQKAMNLYNRCRTPKCLQKWCDEWLTREQWANLQTAIKKRRSRAQKTMKRNPYNDITEVSISITKFTVEAIRIVAKSQNISYVEVIEKYIGPVAAKILEDET